MPLWPLKVKKDRVSVFSLIRDGSELTIWNQIDLVLAVKFACYFCADLFRDGPIH